MKDIWRSVSTVDDNEFFQLRILAAVSSRIQTNKVCSKFYKGLAFYQILICNYHLTTSTGFLTYWIGLWSDVAAFIIVDITYKLSNRLLHLDRYITCFYLYLANRLTPKHVYKQRMFRQFNPCFLGVYIWLYLPYTPISTSLSRVRASDLGLTASAPLLLWWEFS